MTVEAPVTQWIGAVLFVVSLPVWTFIWFWTGFVMGEKYSRWRDPPPKGPPLGDKIAFVAVISYPLVTVALGAGAWIFWSRSVHPAGLVLTILFDLAPFGIFLPPLVGLWFSWRRSRRPRNRSMVVGGNTAAAQLEAERAAARVARDEATQARDAAETNIALGLIEAVTPASDPAPAIATLRRLLQHNRRLDPALRSTVADRLRAVGEHVLNPGVEFPRAWQVEMKRALAVLAVEGTCRCVAVYSLPRYNVDPGGRTDIVVPARNGRPHIDLDRMGPAEALLPGTPVQVHCRECARNWVVSVEDGPEGQVFSWRQWEGPYAERARA